MSVCLCQVLCLPFLPTLWSDPTLQLPLCATAVLVANHGPLLCSLLCCRRGCLSWRGSGWAMTPAEGG